MPRDYLKRLNLILALVLLILMGFSPLVFDSSTFVLAEVESVDFNELDQEPNQELDYLCRKDYFSFKTVNHVTKLFLTDIKPFNQYLSYFANYRGPPNQI